MKRGRSRFLGALVLAFLCCAAAAAEGVPEVKRVIVVLWHGLTWEDASGLQLQGPAAWGLLNTRSGGGDTLSGAYLSIGAGARAVGWRGAERFASREAAEYVYRLHTGLDPGIYVQPDIALIHQAQAAVNYRVEPGALGTALLEAGQTLEVLGSSSAAADYHWAALVGMDRYGRIWHGQLEAEFIAADPRYPFGLRTDYARMAQEVLDAEERLVVVDLGDPFRFDRYQEFLLPTQADVARAVMVAEAGRFVRDLSLQRPEGAVILIISPHPGESRASAGMWLTPVLCLGLGEGLLTSATTRWPGIITNMDVAPTILELLQIVHSQPFIGRAAWIERSKGAAAQLGKMVAKIESLSRWRGLVLRLVVLAQIGIYAVVLAFLILSPPLARRALRLLQGLLLALLAVPLALLFWDLSVFLSAGVVLAVGLLALRWPRPLFWAGVLSLLSAAAIGADILGGSWLMRYSPLGYDPVGGARFYGIGNEFMGVLVGSSIMAWALLVGKKASASRPERLASLLLFAGFITLVGAPALGTNAGGAVSAVFGFAAVWLAFTRSRVSWAWALLAFLCAGLVLGVFTLTDDANAPARQSHLGQTAELFRRDGFAALQLIIRRKLDMNLRLLRFSIWSKALLVTLAAMAASFIWPSRFITWLRKNHPHAVKGIGGVVAGAVAALIFNDSGVVAAATCISFGSTPLLLMALELKHDLAAPEAHIEDDGHSD
ncbi:MAG: hypothetical protein GX266_02270 [Firmicutes bacterium]|jgi:hypothetical protein|nr:hypothetical protein [Bacillota bacterium]